MCETSRIYSIFNNLHISRKYTVQEALDLITMDNYLDEVDGVDIILHPPNNGQKSDEESGDEEVNTDHLTKSQLSAPADIQVVNLPEDEEVSPTENVPVSYYIDRL